MSTAAEVAYRAAILRADAKTLCKKVLANPSVPVKSKTNLAQAHIFSRGLFQASTWSVLSAMSYKCMHAAIMGV